MDYIPGYHNEIFQSIWKRPEALGVPKVWTNVWLGMCICASFFIGTTLGWRWLLLPFGGWLVGHVVLMVLTHLDPQWDDIFLAWMARRYKKEYDAG